MYEDPLQMTLLLSLQESLTKAIWPIMAGTLFTNFHVKISFPEEITNLRLKKTYQG